MDDVLSQTEIDSLLKSLSEGEVDTEQYKKTQEERLDGIVKYDFRRPNKYSKDQLRTLYMIHDNFSRMLSNFLSAYLRSNIQIKITSVDQTTYEDFMVSIPTPTLLTMFKIQPSNESVIMVMNSSFLFPIIDLLFGGMGDTPSSERELTDIELNVMGKLNERILQYLSSAWEDIYDLSPEIDTQETNPQFGQSYSPSETVAIVTLTTVVNEKESLINLCLPFISLEPIISKLSAQYWFAGAGDKVREDLQPKIVRKLERCPVDLTATLGNTTLSVREFLQLQSGDIIPLDKKVNTNLDLWVGNRRKFKVQPGVMGNKLGLYVKGSVAHNEPLKEGSD